MNLHRILTSCSDTEILCDSGDQCINQNYLCNGNKYLGNSNDTNDCLDGSDEKLEYCCKNNYPLYNEEICKIKTCQILDDDICILNKQNQTGKFTC